MKNSQNGYRGVTLYLVASKWEITESLVLRAGYLVELFLQPISPLGRLVLAFQMIISTDHVVNTCRRRIATRY